MPPKPGKRSIAGVPPRHMFPSDTKKRSRQDSDSDDQPKRLRKGSDKMPQKKAASERRVVDDDDEDEPPDAKKVELRRPVHSTVKGPLSSGTHGRAIAVKKTKAHHSTARKRSGTAAAAVQRRRAPSPSPEPDLDPEMDEESEQEEEDAMDVDEEDSDHDDDDDDWSSIVHSSAPENRDSHKGTAEDDDSALEEQIKPTDTTMAPSLSSDFGTVDVDWVESKHPPRPKYPGIPSGSGNQLWIPPQGLVSQIAIVAHIGGRFDFPASKDDDFIVVSTLSRRRKTVKSRAQAYDYEAHCVYAPKDVDGVRGRWIELYASDKKATRAEAYHDLLNKVEHVARKKWHWGEKRKGRLLGADRRVWTEPENEDSSYSKDESERPLVKLASQPDYEYQRRQILEHQREQQKADDKEKADNAGEKGRREATGTKGGMQETAEALPQNTNINTHGTSEVVDTARPADKSQQKLGTAPKEALTATPDVATTEDFNLLT